MNRILPFLLLLFAAPVLHAQQTPFEKGNGNTTATYAELIPYYRQLEKTYPKHARLFTFGKTDIGKPLHLLVLSRAGTFDPVKVRAAKQCVLLINNGIHPGEPEGIDASMMLARDLLKQGKLPANVIICIIPAYNIDGMLNRSATSRANQNGPDAYGFRGNSKNFDLNRDFIKTDSKNSESFQEIFNLWQPQVFVDTHTSNGADYQYTMTLIPSQKDKLQPILGEYLQEKLLPQLYKTMAAKKYRLVPYVNSVQETPDAGITGFMDSPRYSTGYAALHNTIGFMPETHMLKPFNQRVDATYKLLESYIELLAQDAPTIVRNKQKADQIVASQTSFPLEWRPDEQTSSEIDFNGFEAKWKKSDVSGKDRLFYDRNTPYTKPIKQWDNFRPSVMVKKPAAYIVPQGYERVIRLLKLNGVQLRQLTKDQDLKTEMYYITEYKTATRPYEGHYNHYAVKLSAKVITKTFYAGDYIVETNQAANRYILETLEPQATDSFFNWNFFDAILGQKEHFSAYVFEDTAAALLRSDKTLRDKLNQRKLQDTAFANSAAQQLDFVYKNSEYYEKSHLRYPIGRLSDATTPITR